MIDNVFMPDKSSKRKEYKTVQLPKESTIMLDRIIEASPELAYRSHAELVMDLIRRRYEEVVPLKKR